MPRVIAVLLLLFALAACGGSATVTTPSTNAARPTREPTATPEPTSEPIDITFESPLPEGHLVVLTDPKGVVYVIGDRVATKLTENYFEQPLSPKGRYVVSQGELSTPVPGVPASPGPGLTIRDARGAVVATLEGGAADLSWSPDETTVAYRADGKVKLMDLAFGHVRRYEVTSGGQISWSQDGQSLFFGTSPSLTQRLDLKTGQVKTLTNFKPGESAVTSISPDGRYIAYQQQKRDGLAPPPPRIFVYNTETEATCEAVPPTPFSDKNDGGATWSRDSTAFLSIKVTGETDQQGIKQLLITDPATCSMEALGDNVSGYQWSPFGNVLLLGVRTDITAPPTSAMSNIYLWTAAQGIRPLDRTAQTFSWSLDGSRIVAVDKTFNSTARLIDPSTNTEVDFDFKGCFCDGQWSPDGSYFAMLDKSPDEIAIQVVDPLTGSVTTVATYSLEEANEMGQLLAWAP